MSTVKLGTSSPDVKVNIVATGATPSETPVQDPGPSLVIDTIGPPTGGNPFCPGYEDEPVEDDQENVDQN